MRDVFLSFFLSFLSMLHYLKCTHTLILLYTHSVNNFFSLSCSLSINLIIYFSQSWAIIPLKHFHLHTYIPSFVNILPSHIIILLMNIHHHHYYHVYPILLLYLMMDTLHHLNTMMMKKLFFLNIIIIIIIIIDNTLIIESQIERVILQGKKT